jgi:peroxiredoxin
LFDVFEEEEHMKHSAFWKVATLSVTGAFLLALSPSSTPDATAAVGAPAPAFTLEDQDGNEVSLSDFSGKVVVLEWTNWDCPFVQRHYRSGTFTKLFEKFKDQGIVWLAVNSTNYATAEKDKEWIEQYNLPYPILSDFTGRVGKMYDAKTTPHMYIIDKTGTLVYAGGIDDDPQGESENPTNYVENALNEVLAGKDVSVPESKPYGCSVKYAKPH